MLWPGIDIDLSSDESSTEQRDPCASPGEGKNTKGPGASSGGTGEAGQEDTSSYTTDKEQDPESEVGYGRVTSESPHRSESAEPARPGVVLVSNNQGGSSAAPNDQGARSAASNGQGAPSAASDGQGAPSAASNGQGDSSGGGGSKQWETVHWEDVQGPRRHKGQGVSSGDQGNDDGATGAKPPAKDEFLEMTLRS